MQILASRLRAIGVVSDRGLQIGRLADMTFDEKDGKILSLVVKPISRESLTGIPKDPDGNVMIPFSAVMSIRDFIIVNERVLAIQQLKTPPPIKQAGPAEPAPLPPERKP
ncbi:MAG: PRC-barrel domain-containing protein [Candidatus Hadarchaeota archaeon]